MLSEEEKKAIEYLKKHTIPYVGIRGTIELFINDVILNLIKKQQELIDLQGAKLLEFGHILTFDYIRKDKIRAKIKELEEIEPADDDYNFELQNDIHSKIDILKELLEEN